MQLSRILTIAILTIAIPATTLPMTGCAVEEDTTDEDELDELLDASDPIALPDDLKGDLAGGATAVRAARYGASFAIATYDKYGRELSRLSGTRSGRRTYGTIVGYGASVTIDITYALASSGTVTVNGTIGGQPLALVKKPGQNPTGSGAVLLTTKQQQLADLWGAMLPTVMERAKADLVDCLLAIAGALGYAAICRPWNPFTWGACSDLVDAVRHAYSTCSDALN